MSKVKFLEDVKDSKSDVTETAIVLISDAVPTPSLPEKKFFNLFSTETLVALGKGSGYFGGAILCAAAAPLLPVASMGMIFVAGTSAVIGGGFFLQGATSMVQDGWNAISKSGMVQQDTVQTMRIAADTVMGKPGISLNTCTQQTGAHLALNNQVIDSAVLVMPAAFQPSSTAMGTEFALNMCAAKFGFSPELAESAIQFAKAASLLLGNLPKSMPRSPGIEEIVEDDKKQPFLAETPGAKKSR